MFQNVAHRPTVYRTGVCTYFGMPCSDSNSTTARSPSVPSFWYPSYMVINRALKSTMGFLSSDPTEKPIPTVTLLFSDLVGRVMSRSELCSEQSLRPLLPQKHEAAVRTNPRIMKIKKGIIYSLINTR